VYGTADQSEKSEERQQADRYRAIKRLSTAFSNSTTLTSAVASHQTNATPLNMAGGLALPVPNAHAGRANSVDARKVKIARFCLTQTWPRRGRANGKAYPNSMHAP
jgi:hypothetical protein